jgi:hypothetical protein
MAKKQAQAGKAAGKKAAAGADKPKGHVMTNPSTGEVRYVTEDDYRKNEAEYLAGGFHRPNAIASS